MVAGYSNKGEAHLNYLQALVRNHHIGGVIMMQGELYKQQEVVEKLQSSAKIPLLIGQDAEYGQAMRLRDAYKFPTALTVGAGSHGKLTYDLGIAMAKECVQAGVHISFSPVLDVNTNPQNPIIGARSFGSDVHNVTLQGKALISGIQREGVLACGKHFPGHGDTQEDSHKTLPQVNRTLEELDSVEWAPFKMAVDAGVASIMVAHLNIPSLEPSGTPTSLSKRVVTEILREDWGYDGLIITDALNMKGASEFAPTGQLEVMAFLAGNDVLLFPADVDKAINAMKEALESGVFTSDRLDQSVRRILLAKQASRAPKDWALAQQNNLLPYLRSLYPTQSEQNNALTFELVDRATTLLPTGLATFPIQNLEQQFLHLAIGDTKELQTIADYLDRYAEMPHFTLANFSLSQVDSADVIIVSFHQKNTNPWQRYKLNEEEIAILEQLSQTGKPLYIMHLANPYGVLTYPELQPNHKIVILYENNKAAQIIAPQKLFGARPVQGRLSADLEKWGAVGSNLKTESIQRLKYGPAWEVGIRSSELPRIDSIMLHAMAEGATPGGQILVARKGQVVYEKCFGTLDGTGRAVNWKDMYDLASVTKITATLPGMMQWYEKQPMLLESTLGHHSTLLKGTNKDSLVISDVLAHQSGLDAWIPFYLRTIKDTETREYWYSEEPQDSFFKVVPKLYLRKTIRDTVYAQLANSPLKSKTYRYSDLGYYLFQSMLEERFNEPLDQWVKHAFYSPLGAKRLTYNPLENGFTKAEIAPTDEDSYWRNTKVHGTVHDMGAAMLGGVAGHAGLFSNANDLAKMMQMYLNGGSYGGQQYLQPETVQKFSSCAFCDQKNRRGLGFDRPQLDPEGPGPSCTCASDLSFGHTGFTGTMVWMDPKEELLYIFLSNRTYPDMENWKLSRLDVRTNIQSIIYDSLIP